MAIIDFQVLLDGAGGSAGTAGEGETLSGSGLGFFGTTQGSSVQIGSYQDSTYVSNGDGSSTVLNVNNIKYVSDTYPSGKCVVNAAGGSSFNVGLSGVKSTSATLGIRFGHTSAVKVQNCQLRIYDRENSINFPATGVNTKVAEIVNFNGGDYNGQGSSGGSSNVVGSGDAFWWGEPWPDQYVTNNWYENSLGTKFYNGLYGGGAGIVNPDRRLNNGVATGDNETVGGTGIIVPLLDSPGSGQQNLYKGDITDAAAAIPGMMWPKWTQYVKYNDGGDDQACLFGAGNDFGNGSLTANKKKSFGGTGVDTHHTWAVALSASPLNIGSKEQYGLYVSLEYL